MNAPWMMNEKAKRGLVFTERRGLNNTRELRCMWTSKRRTLKKDICFTCDILFVIERRSWKYNKKSFKGHNFKLKTYFLGNFSMCCCFVLSMLLMSEQGFFLSALAYGESLDLWARRSWCHALLRS